MKRLTLFYLLFFSVQTAFSQFEVNYKKADGLLDISPYISYLADTSQNLTFEQVQKLPYSSFTQNKKIGLSLGNQDLPHWFRIDFADTTFSEDLFLYTDFPLRYLDVYLIDKNGSVQTWKTGLMRPFGGRYFLTNSYTYNLGRNTTQVFFRTQSPTLHLPFLVGTIQPLFEFNFYYIFFVGGLLGLILGLVFYNLFLYITLKDSTFLYYSCYELTLFYLTLKGMGTHHVFLPHFPQWFFADNITSTVVCIFFIFLFVNKFLNVKNLTPKLYFWYVLLLSCFIVLMIFEWTIPYQAWHGNLFNILIIVNSISVMLGGAYIWYLGYEPAKYFTLAWFLFLISVIIRYLSLANILPKNVFWVDFAVQMGIACESILLSFAVAYRFNLFRKEARDAQALVLQRSEENERLLEAHNQILEEKIRLERQVTSPTSTQTNGINELLEKLQSERSKNKKLAVSTIEGVLLLPILDIIRLEALGSYCTIYLNNKKKIVASKPMADFEPFLDKTDFIRIHKSHIVNVNFIERYIRGEGGQVVMPDGVEVSVSRLMKTELLEKLNIT